MVCDYCKKENSVNLNKKFTEWIDNEHYNILTPQPMTLAEFEYFITKYLLPDNYIIVSSVNDAQARTCMLYEILSKYSERFREEIDEYNGHTSHFSMKKVKSFFHKIFKK